MEIKKINNIINNIEELNIDYLYTLKDQFNAELNKYELKKLYDSSAFDFKKFEKKDALCRRLNHLIAFRLMIEETKVFIK